MHLKPASITAVILTAGVAVGLAACAPQGALGTCTPAGVASDSVTITGDFGGELSWSFDKALAATTIERTVAIAGAPGDGAVDGQTVNAYYTVFDGLTGEPIERGSDIAATPMPFLNDSEVYSPGIVAALNCATDGSRVVTVMPAAEAFGENAAALGVEATAPIVLVLDVESVTDTVLPESTEPVAVPRDAALRAPAVDFSGAVPTVTLPESAPPSDFQLEVLEVGDGAIVAPGANVTVDYHGVSWDSGLIFDSSFERGQPATFSTDGVIAGFRDALVGQTVGSVVVATIPPAMAYGTDAAAHQLGGQTLVFVVRILAAQ